MTNGWYSGQAQQASTDHYTSFKWLGHRADTGIEAYNPGDVEEGSKASGQLLVNAIALNRQASSPLPSISNSTYWTKYDWLIIDWFILSSQEFVSFQSRVRTSYNVFQISPRDWILGIAVEEKFVKLSKYGVQSSRQLCVGQLGIKLTKSPVNKLAW